MGMVHTCFKQVWATQGISLYTHCSAMLLSWFLSIPFNAVEVQQKREKKAASLAWAAQQMPLWTWDLMRKQAKKQADTQSIKERWRFQKFTSAKNKGDIKVDEKETWWPVDILEGKPIPKFSTRRFKNPLTLHSGSLYFIPFQRWVKTCHDLANLQSSISRSKGVGHVNKLLLRCGWEQLLLMQAVDWCSLMFTSLVKPPSYKLFFCHINKIVIFLAFSIFLCWLNRSQLHRSLSWNHEPNDSRARVANSKDSEAMEGNRS